MVLIFVTEEAFEAIKATLPVGSVAFCIDDSTQTISPLPSVRSRREARGRLRTRRTPSGPLPFFTSDCQSGSRAA
jgi:hypothetical protein